MGYGNSQFVALDSVNNTDISPDGITWTAVGTNGMTNGRNCRFGNNLWSAWSIAGLTMISHDGKKWHNLGDVSASYPSQGCLYTNGLFFAGLIASGHVWVGKGIV